MPGRLRGHYYADQIDIPSGRLLLGGRAAAAARPGVGHTYYVDTNGGADVNSGSSWDAALKTMAAAFAKLASGDTVYFVGNVREQLSTPVQVFDVSIIGAGNRPRHADSTPAGGELAGSTWKLPASNPVQTTPLLTIRQQGWHLENILFAGPTTAACVQLLRDGGAGNAERDASHAEIMGCRFASGRDGIEQSGGCYNVLIEGNSFHDLTGYALKNTGGAGIAAPYRWVIANNDFDGCANWMGTWNCHAFTIRGNTIREITTDRLDTSGGSGHNMIIGNFFDIAASDMDASGNIAGHATDVWSNYLLDTIETGVPA